MRDDDALSGPELIMFLAAIIFVFWVVLFCDAPPRHDPPVGFTAPTLTEADP